MHIYHETCNKHTTNAFPKKSFTDDIKYDLESALDVYLQFFTD